MYYTSTGFPPRQWERTKRVIAEADGAEISLSPDGEILVQAIGEDGPLPSIAVTPKELYQAVAEAAARKSCTPFPPSPGAYTTTRPYPQWVEPHRK